MVWQFITTKKQVKNLYKETFKIEIHQNDINCKPFGERKVFLLISKIIKKAPIVFNWRLLAVVTHKGQISNHFMADLKKLAYYM